MAAMTIEEVRGLAEMARIKLSDEELKTLSGEFTAVLEYVGQVNDIVADDDLTKQVGPVHNVFRADEVTNEAGAHTEDLLTEAPERMGNMLKVKKILNQDQ